MANDRDWKPDPTSHVYVYLQVANHIAEQIRTERLPIGARLPGERDLAEQFGIAVTTARRAIRELRDQGLVMTVPVKGTFVRAGQPSSNTSEEDESAS